MIDKQRQLVYVRLADVIRSQILAAQFTERIPSVRALADEYAINFKTVQKALDLLVDEGLLYQVQGKGTFVARQTSHLEPTLCGLVLPDFVNPYFARTAESLEEVGSQQGIAFLLNAVGRQPSRLRSVLETYRKRGVRVAVIHGGALRNEANREVLRSSSLTLIGFHTRSIEMDDVWPDVRAGAQLAADHLLDSFGGEVAFVSGSDDPIEETGRFRGYRDSLLSHGLRVNPSLLLEVAPTYKGGYQAVKSLVDRSTIPRSIIFYNQVMAMGGMNALRSLQLRVPEDVAAVGIDDSVNVEEMVLPTSAISFPFETAARQTVTLVQRRLSHPDQDPISIRLPPKLIVRQSSRTSQ